MRTESGEDAFVHELHRALTYLYDAGTLRRSPLVGLLGVEAQPDPGVALQRALVEEIEALRPGDAVPPTSSAWRAYRVLFYRFVEGFTQQQVATDLAISTRQLRRYEQAALQALADALRCRYRPAEHDVQSARQQAGSAVPEAEGQERELEWLKHTIPTEPIDLAAMLRAVLVTVSPLLSSLRVRVDNRVQTDLPRIAAQAATVRQALLNLVTTTARCAQGGEIHLTSEALPGPDAAAVRLTVAANAVQATEDAAAQRPQLDIARELLRLSGAHLDVVQEQSPLPGATFVVTVTFPLAGRTPVLVIDDNLDTLRLLERYLAGSRYRFSAASDPETGLRLAEREPPAAIILDVMMPGVDGWDLLGRLREHPRTRDVPILVCTILPEEQLALTLGAAGFLQKPVSPRTLLMALDRLVAEAQGCR